MSVEQEHLSEAELENVVRVFAILRNIKVVQIKLDAKKYLGIDLEKFQSPRELIAAGEKLEPSNQLNSGYC